MSSRGVRSAARALIVRDGQLLVTVNNGSDEFWMIPGGGQRHGETLHQALQRECLEEIGCEVEIGELAWVRDYLAAHHEHGYLDPHFQQVDHAFWCRLPDRVEPVNSGTGDRFQSGVRWVRLDELADAPLWPRVVKTWLLTPADRRPIYLGDVN